MLIAGYCGPDWGVAAGSSGESPESVFVARPRIGAVRHRGQRRRMRHPSLSCHRAFRIQQVIVASAPVRKSDQRTRIRHRLRLPAVIGF